MTQQYYIVWIMKVWGFQRSKLSPKIQLLSTVWQYWLGIVDPKNVLRSFLTHSKKLLWTLKIFCLVKISTNWLTDFYLLYLLWIAEMLFMLFCALLLCYGQKIAEYKAYWLMGIPIIKSLWHTLAIFSHKAVCTN